LTEALAACDDRASRRVCLGEAKQWELQIVSAGASHLLLRATDRHEQTRALQRQLDDREQLLFTSRVILGRRDGDHAGA
jgi:hypothetical protein